MNTRRLLNLFRTSHHDQRGVTLTELIAVIALMTLVFGGAVSLLISLYDSYGQTVSVSSNGREAAMTIEQLTQDIRKSVSTPDQKAVRTDPDTGGILITTEKQIDRIETVEYRNQAGKILYVSGTTELELSPSGEVVVEELEEDKRYQITVIAGIGEGQVELTTEVARYDWGEVLDEAKP